MRTWVEGRAGASGQDEVGVLVDSWSERISEQWSWGVRGQLDWGC